jgi:uncharacterized membrane protein YhaH (DUF805 family)
MTHAPSPKATARLARGPFALAVTTVYLASFASQVLLSPPVTSYLSVAPFALAQAVLIVIWVVLHRRRLHDAGKPTGIVIGVALVYALEVVLLAILVGLMLASTPSTTDGVGPGAPILNLFVLLYFLSLLTGDASLGVLQIWITGFVAVMLLPVAIALGFSIWAATRPTAAAAP